MYGGFPSLLRSALAADTSTTKTRWALDCFIRTSLLKRSPKIVRKSVGQRKLSGQLPNTLAHLVGCVKAFNVQQNFANHVANRCHFLLFHSPCRDGWCADANPTSLERRTRFKRNRVLVYSDPSFIQRELTILASHTFRAHVDEHQMIIRASAHQSISIALHPFRESLRILHNLLLILLKRRLQSFLEADRLRRNHMHQRPALDSRERLRIDFLRVFFFAHDKPAA